MPERTYRVSLRPAEATKRMELGQDQFWTDVGAAFGLRGVIVTYVDGEPVDQSSVAGPTPTTMVPPSWQGTIRGTGECDPLRAIQRQERIG